MMLGETLVRWTRRSVAVTAIAAAAIPGASPAGSPADSAAGRAAAPAKTITDPAVRPAGGLHCSHCGTGRCQHGQRAGHGHHAGCRNGVCVPYCPVRPHQFGFYGTRWRKWPGQDVVPVSAERGVTPAVPPRSAVPGADEESMSPRAGDFSANEPGMATPPAADGPGGPGQLDQPSLEPAPMPQPGPEPQPAPPARPAAPTADEDLFPARPRGPAEPTPPAGPEPKAEPKPEPKAEPARPEDENLFEVLSGTRARRKFFVQESARAASRNADRSAPVRQARHAEPARPLDVPPVPFDAAAETRRILGTR
jgi:hypothetical protein